MDDCNSHVSRYYATLARARQGAGALITTTDGRVVMINTTYRDFYEIPGGAVEAGESPPQTCARECEEELGSKIAVGRLLAIDHQSDADGRGDSVMYVYDGGSIDPLTFQIHRGDAEVDGIAMVEPRHLDSVTIPRLANRLRGAMAARAAGTVYEAINGAVRR